MKMSKSQIRPGTCWGLAVGWHVGGRLTMERGGVRRIGQPGERGNWEPGDLQSLHAGSGGRPVYDVGVMEQITWSQNVPIVLADHIIHAVRDGAAWVGSWGRGEVQIKGGTNPTSVPDTPTIP